jgi:hypothetical protein
MMIRAFCASLLLTAVAPALAQNAIPVTIDNFVRAESDFYKRT